MTSKTKVPRKEMMEVARQAVETGSVLRIWEEEDPHRGRIVQVTEKGHVLIVR